jgi:glycosyltransferase involved in cell wall biosynthesis
VRLSVVLPTLNGAETIGEQLDALARQDWDEGWELVVADNGSTDATLDVVESYRGRLPALLVVDASDRRGMAHAINVGVRAATGDAVLFVNDDDIVADGWLAAMGTALRSHDVVAGTLEFDRLNEPWAIAVRGRPQSEELVRFELGELPFAFAATIGVSKRLHDEIGGFDEELDTAGEDVDYSWRLQYAGRHIHFVPGAVTHYRLRGGLRDVFIQARRYGEGLVLIYLKHRSGGLERRGRWRHGIRGWLGVAKALAGAHSKAGVATFAWKLGWRLGMVTGSLKYRVFLF